MKADNFPVKKSIALLLDPDKAKGDSLRNILKTAVKSKTDYIFAGGSLTFTSIDNLINEIRKFLFNSCNTFPRKPSSAYS